MKSKRSEKKRLMKEKEEKVKCKVEEVGKVSRVKWR